MREYGNIVKDVNTLSPANTPRPKDFAFFLVQWTLFNTLFSKIHQAPVQGPLLGFS